MRSVAREHGHYSHKARIGNPCSRRISSLFLTYSIFMYVRQQQAAEILSTIPDRFFWGSQSDLMHDRRLARGLRKDVTRETVTTRKKPRVSHLPCRTQKYLCNQDRIAVGQGTFTQMPFHIGKD